MAAGDPISNYHKNLRFISEYYEEPSDYDARDRYATRVRQTGHPTIEGLCGIERDTSREYSKALFLSYLSLQYHINFLNQIKNSF
jgi:hypothetical protein